jgi:hypothetical protein
VVLNNLIFGMNDNKSYSKYYMKILSHGIIWVGGFLVINFSGWFNYVGVFNTIDGSLFTPSIYGLVFNALIFYGNSELLLKKLQSKGKIYRYLLILTVSFGLLILIESLLDFLYYNNFYNRRGPFIEILTGNLILDSIFFLIPSYLYRFGKDWFKTSKETKPENIDLQKDFISVKSGNTLHRLNINDILYLESDGNYVKYHLKNRSVMTRDSLSNIEKTLPVTDFIRSHKSFIISIKNTSSISYDTDTLNNKEVPIGRAFRDNVLKRFKEN